MNTSCARMTNILVCDFEREFHQKLFWKTSLLIHSFLRARLKIRVKIDLARAIVGLSYFFTFVIGSWGWYWTLGSFHPRYHRLLCKEKKYNYIHSFYITIKIYSFSLALYHQIWLSAYIMKALNYISIFASRLILSSSHFLLLLLHHCSYVFGSCSPHLLLFHHPVHDVGCCREVVSRAHPVSVSVPFFLFLYVSILSLAARSVAGNPANTSIASSAYPVNTSGWPTEILPLWSFVCGYKRRGMEETRRLQFVTHVPFLLLNATATS